MSQLLSLGLARACVRARKSIIYMWKDEHSRSFDSRFCLANENVTACAQVLGHNSKNTTNLQNDDKRKFLVRGICFWISF